MDNTYIFFLVYFIDITEKFD